MLLAELASLATIVGFVFVPGVWLSRRWRRHEAQQRVTGRVLLVILRRQSDPLSRQLAQDVIEAFELARKAG